MLDWLDGTPAVEAIKKWKIKRKRVVSVLINDGRKWIVARLLEHTDWWDFKWIVNRHSYEDLISIEPHFLSKGHNCYIPSHRWNWKLTSTPWMTVMEVRQRIRLILPIGNIHAGKNTSFHSLDESSRPWSSRRRWQEDLPYHTHIRPWWERILWPTGNVHGTPSRLILS